MSRALAAATVLALLMPSACSIKAYPGAERPREEIARLYIGARDSKNVTILEVMVDGQEHTYFNSGIDILPGRHTAGADFTAADGTCDYALKSEYCYEQTYSMRCAAEFTAKAGGTYSASIIGNGLYASMKIVDLDTDEYLGGAECRTR